MIPIVGIGEKARVGENKKPVAPVRVIVVDDSRVYLEAVSFALSRNPKIDFQGAAQDAEMASYLIRTRMPQVALVDVRMPGGGGPGLARQIRSEHPEVRVVALTVSREDSDLWAMLRAGACGYVLKGDADGLPQAILATGKGHSWISPEIAPKLIAAYLGSAAASLEDGIESKCDLTLRERSVLACMASGNTNSEIAKRLYIAETTVKTHVKNIFAKLGVRNRSEAAALAWRMGVAEEE